jgi:hypothetical protein
MAVRQPLDTVPRYWREPLELERPVAGGVGDTLQSYGRRVCQPRAILLIDFEEENLIHRNYWSIHSQHIVNTVDIQSILVNIQSILGQDIPFDLFGAW